MQFLKIMVMAVLAAVAYGIVHDQITIRIYLPYFTVFHPQVFPTESPTLLALGWGILATWWAGLFMGLLLALAARAGRDPKIAARELVRPVAFLLLIMAAAATFFGWLGFHLASRHVLQVPNYLSLEKDDYPRFMAAWWAHNTSYAVGFLGSIVLSIMTLIRRWRMGHHSVVQRNGLPISQ